MLSVHFCWRAQIEFPKRHTRFLVSKLTIGGYAYSEYASSGTQLLPFWSSPLSVSNQHWTYHARTLHAVHTISHWMRHTHFPFTRIYFEILTSFKLNNTSSSVQLNHRPKKNSAAFICSIQLIKMTDIPLDSMEKIGKAKKLWLNRKWAIFNCVVNKIWRKKIWSVEHC